MVLPDYILGMAGVERDILFLGSLNKWELWNPEVYDSYIEENNPSLEKLTKEINFNAIFKNDG
jgi:DNA-binding transcriptional regulator/RsmH inhibitor MraZ